MPPNPPAATDPPPEAAPRRPDPVLTSSRRELYFTLGLFVVAMTYTLTVCATMGYGRDVATLTFVFGFPDWVFWGVAAPWAACAFVSIVFAYGFMTDDDLGNDDDEAPVGPTAEKEADGE
ncbi:MAG: hypothetical protein ACRDD1_22285 [Planctomycetia bacterium]